MFCVLCVLPPTPPTLPTPPAVQVHALISMGNTSGGVAGCLSDRSVIKVGLRLRRPHSRQEPGRRRRAPSLIVSPPPPGEVEEFKVGERVRRRRLRSHVIDASPTNSDSMCQPALCREIKGRLYVGAAEPRRSIVSATYSATQKAGALPAHGRNQTLANEAGRDKKKKP